MQDELIFNFMKATIFDEVIPTLTLPKQDLIDFTQRAVITRFNNPYVKAHTCYPFPWLCIQVESKMYAELLGYIEEGSFRYT